MSLRITNSSYANIISEDIVQGILKRKMRKAKQNQETVVDADSLPFLLKVVDILVALSLVGHLTIAGWRGAWTLMDWYVVPSHHLWSAVLTLVVGTIMCGSGSSLMPVCHRYTSKENMIQFIGARLLLNYWMVVGTVGLWRGVWLLEDMYFGLTLKSGLICSLVSFITICILRINRNCVPPPLLLSYDYSPNVCDIQGRLKMKSSKPGLFVLDQFVTKFVLESLAVSLWRPIWNIQNEVLFADTHLMPNTVSCILGYCLCLFIISIQRSMILLSMEVLKYGRVVQLIVEDTFVLLATIGTISLWRGFWNILEMDLLPDPVVGGWSCHLVGVLGLMSLGTLSSAYCTTCAIDGEITDSTAYWSLKYLQIIWKKKNIQHDSDVKELSKTLINDQPEKEIDNDDHSATTSLIKASTTGHSSDSNADTTVRSPDVSVQEMTPLKSSKCETAEIL